MSDEKTKIWITVATVNNFTEADQIRITLKEKYESVKVKRGGKGGDIFRVKAWNPPPPQKEIIKKEKTYIKKGINHQRRQKHDNKKIRH